MIDLYATRFWLLVVFAVVLLAPINRGGPRQWVFAAINILFLVVYLKSRAVEAAAIPVCAFFALQAIHRARPAVGYVLCATCGVVLLSLFLVHKLPSLGKGARLESFAGVMDLVGFSYVALRLVDLGRAVSEARRPPPTLASTINYLLPFHMLTMGPIQAYDDFCDQPAVPPPLGFAASLRAFERIGQGLFKKYILANFIQEVLLTDFRSRGLYYFIEVQLNYLWLYLDFSAYSDVAVGVGMLTGFVAPENFNKPYLARNMIDYWERWHISLSQFIRRNLFIPLQLALVRRTEGRFPLWIASFAFTVSFLLCGLWHRMNVGWFLWGAYHAAGLVVCNLYRAYLLKRLGRKGLNKYMENPWIRGIAIVVVYEYVAFSLVVASQAFPTSTTW